MNVNHTAGMSTTDGSVAKVTSKEAAKRQEAIQVAHQFEEIFVGMMVQGFRKSQLSEEGGMFGGGVGSSTYEQWFDQHMSTHLAKSSSIGIADTLIRDFRRLGVLPKVEHDTKPTPTTGANHVA